jgi:hypothetical protein
MKSAVSGTKAEVCVFQILRPPLRFGIYNLKPSVDKPESSVLMGEEITGTTTSVCKFTVRSCPSGAVGTLTYPIFVFGSTSIVV